MDAPHGLTPPEATIVGWANRIPPASRVLDIAAGSGRHANWLAAQGHQVTALDRDTAALCAQHHPNVRIVTADLENAPWPLADQQFDAVIVVNYLWRPLLPTIIASVALGGHLLYETFGVGNERFGRPRNPDYLLRPGELRQAVEDHLEVLDASEGTVGEPPHAVRQRLLARRPA